MKYILKLIIFIFLAFVMIACGNTDSSNEVSSANITITSSKNTLDTSRTKMEIDFLLTSSYSSSITLQVKELVLNTSPCKIGSAFFFSVC